MTPDIEMIPRRQAAPQYLWVEDCTVDEEEWLIDGLLPSKAYVGMFGARGSAKSFLALEMAFAGATGEAFLGLETEPFATLYCVGEKIARFTKRVVAWRQDRAAALGLDGLSEAPGGVRIRTSVPNLLDPISVADFIEELNGLKPTMEARGAPLKCVMLDTLSRCLRGGNVSDPVVAGVALAHIQDIVDQTGLTVIPIAHVAKSKGETFKGAGEWENNADALIRIDRKETSPVRMVTNTKQSDGKDGAQWAFELKEVTVGVNKKGKKITSCVIVMVEVPDSQAAIKMNAADAALMRAFDNLVFTERCRPAPPLEGVKPKTQAVRICDLREESYLQGLYKGMEPPEGSDPIQFIRWTDNRKKAFQRALDRLQVNRKLRLHDDSAWAI